MLFSFTRGCLSEERNHVHNLISVHLFSYGFFTWQTVITFLTAMSVTVYTLYKVSKPNADHSHIHRAANTVLKMHLRMFFFIFISQV